MCIVIVCIVCVCVPHKCFHYSTSTVSLSFYIECIIIFVQRLHRYTIHTEIRSMVRIKTQLSIFCYLKLHSNQPYSMKRIVLLLETTNNEQNTNTNKSAPGSNPIPLAEKYLFNILFIFSLLLDCYFHLTH